MLILTMMLTELKKLFTSPVDKLKEEIIAMVNSLPGDGKKPEELDPTANYELTKKYIKDMDQYPIKACWMKLIPIILIEEDINIVYKLFQEKEQEIEMLEDQTYQYVLNKSSRENLKYPQYLIYKSLIDNNKTMLEEVYVAFDNASKM